MKHGRDDDAASLEAKKPSHPESHDAGIASLPLPALTLVWSYAVSLSTSDGVCDNAEHQLLLRDTHDLQLVCRTWRSHMQDVLREKLRGVAIIDVVAAAKAHGDSTEKLVISVDSFDKAAPVTDLRVVMGDIFSGHDFNDNGIWMDDEQALIAVRVQRAPELHKKQPEIDWEATLKPCGETVTRLDLSRMLLNTKHLGEFLRAAAKLCPNVKALIMPPKENKMYKNESTREDNMDSLSAAMKTWKESNGGLTHLRVPFVGMDLISTLTYVNNISVCCPDLEHFDGWRFTFIEQCNLEFVTCDELIMAPPELWADLWKRLTKLKTFNTVVIPFAEDFYAEMTEHEKPALEELTISFNSLYANPSPDMDSALFQELVQTVPNLRKLAVVCGDPGSDEWSPGDGFDDKFLNEVSVRCPKLEKLAIKSYQPVETISVAGLTALFSMPELKNITIRSLPSLDDSFLDLLDERMRKKQPLRLRLTVKRMNDLIWKVMSRIGSMKPEEFDGVQLSLSLMTPDVFGHRVEDPKDQNGRLHKAEDIEKLYDAIKSAFGPIVRVHLHTTPPHDPEDDFVQFDSLELSINDPENFSCMRDKSIEIGNEDIEQDLCGEDVRRDGIYERDPDGALEVLETIISNDRPRRLHVPGLMSDDEYENSEDDGDEFRFDDGDAIELAGDDDDESVEESDDEGDIFGNGEEDEDEDDEEE